MAKSANGGIPAWMVCVDILNKAKRELVTQAVETLEKEVEAKRIDIKGSMLTVPDQSSDDEMKLFVIGQVLRNAEQMRKRYGSYIKEVHTKGANATSQEVESAERARLFLMAVEKIEILVQYSRQLDTWINDVSMEVAMDDPARILSKTSASGERTDVLAFILKNPQMKNETIFSEQERQIIERAANRL
jgi:hypothetical protein